MVDGGSLKIETVNPEPQNPKAPNPYRQGVVDGGSLKIETVNLDTGSKVVCLNLLEGDYGKSVFPLMGEGGEGGFSIGPSELKQVMSP